VVEVEVEGFECSVLRRARSISKIGERLRFKYFGQRLSDDDWQRDVVYSLRGAERVQFEEVANECSGEYVGWRVYFEIDVLKEASS
jgi:hypothetical protein